MLTFTSGLLIATRLNVHSRFQAETALTCMRWLLRQALWGGGHLGCGQLTNSSTNSYTKSSFFRQPLGILPTMLTTYICTLVFKAVYPPSRCIYLRISSCINSILLLIYIHADLMKVTLYRAGYLMIYGLV